MRRPDYDRLASLDRRLARERSVDPTRNLKIVDALRDEAVALGVWNQGDPLAGIEVDVRVARVVNRLGDV